MEPTSNKSTIIAAGLAMFSMFFGAGNVVFPLALGKFAQNQTFFAMLGLILTAVGVPVLGLMTMTLFNGNYQHFFERIGKIPGFLVTLGIMGLIGPFGAIPRCITLSYSTMSIYHISIGLPFFSILACLLIFLFTFRKTGILDILGYYLTPILLLSLSIIIIKGLYHAPEIPQSDLSAWQAFGTGLKEGYQTMDLFGAFFFSSIVISCLEKGRVPSDHKNYRQVIFMTLKASAIATLLLAFIYVGFSYVAAHYSPDLGEVEKDQLLGTLALKILGPYAGVIAIIAVALACLTTAIALSAVFSEFLHQDVTQGKLSYISSLGITLLITCFVSTLSFDGIARFLIPILEVCYPAMIVMSICGLAHKLKHIDTVKLPVITTFVASLAIGLKGLFTQ